MNDLTHGPHKPLVAIFDGFADAAEMMATAIGLAGFRTVDGHVADVKRGVTDFVSFIEAHNPDVVVWDISPPYQGNWNFFQLVRSSSALDGRGIVLTTTHKGHLDALTSGDSGALEIVGKPVDIDELVRRIRYALRHRDQTPPLAFRAR
jgi:DNA-binding response OmpR family regulator